jgi:DNA-binding response OmpR family regulator
MNLTILHVEDDRLISEALAELLAAEGWHVQTCADGLTALALIEGDTPYDLILLDNELPHVGGLELMRRARQTPHRARTPVVTLSANEIGAEARDAGADLFLRKPQDVGLIVRAVELLTGRKRQRAGRYPRRTPLSKQTGVPRGRAHGGRARGLAVSCPARQRYRVPSKLRLQLPSMSDDASAGPYSADTAEQRQRNLDAMNEAAAGVMRRGHIPVIGVNAALPIVERLGTAVDRYEAIMAISLALVAQCEAILVIGESAGANRERDSVMS